MIPSYVDVEDCYICLKLIDGTTVHGIGLSKKDLADDFGIEQVNENSITLYSPLVYSKVSTEEEDGVSKLINIPVRYNPGDMCPFMEFPLDKIIVIYNMDETSINLFDSAVEYLEAITDNTFESHLENSIEFLGKAVENSRKLSNEQILNTLDEDSTRH